MSQLIYSGRDRVGFRATTRVGPTWTAPRAARSPAELLLERIHSVSTGDLTPGRTLPLTLVPRLTISSAVDFPRRMMDSARAGPRGLGASLTSAGGVTMSKSIGLSCVAALTALAITAAPAAAGG